MYLKRKVDFFLEEWKADKNRKRQMFFMKSSKNNYVKVFILIFSL